jgi:hypothetical protein
MPDDILDGSTGSEGNDGSTGNDDQTMTFDQFKEQVTQDGKWRDLVSKDYATDPATSNFTKLDDVVKSYIHTKKAFGDRIERPKEDWTKADWDRWNSEYNPGYPKDPADYNFELELDGYEIRPEQEEKFRKWAHDNGLTRSQAERTWKNLHMDRYEQKKAQLDSMKKKVGETIAELKREYGNAYDDKISKAQQAMRKFLPEEYITKLKSTPLDKEMVQFFIKVGENLGEGKLEKSSKPSTSLTPREALAKYNKFVEDNKDAYLQRQHPRHEDVLAKATKLMEDAYPDEE